MTTPARHSDAFDPPEPDSPTRADLDDMAREHAEAVERNRVAAWREYVRDEPEGAAADPWAECSAVYGHNPDACNRFIGHKGAHSNRYGTTWEAK